MVFQNLLDKLKRGTDAYKEADKLFGTPDLTVGEDLPPEERPNIYELLFQPWNPKVQAYEKSLNPTGESQIGSILPFIEEFAKKTLPEWTGALRYTGLVPPPEGFSAASEKRTAMSEDEPPPPEPLTGKEVIESAVYMAMPPMGTTPKAGKLIHDAWNTLSMAQRVNLVKNAGLKGAVAGKAWAKLLPGEKAALSANEFKAIPKAIEGMPEAGLQPEMFGGAPKEVKPLVGETPLAKEQPPVVSEIPPVKPPEVSPVQALNPPTPPGGNILGDLQDVDELVNVMTKPDVYRKIANLPGIKQIMSYLNPAGVAETIPQKAIVARAALREEGTNKAIGAFSRLQTLGTRDAVWGKLSQEGFIPKGKLGGLSLDDVLTYRKKYNDYLTPQQRQWAETFHELEQAKLKLLKDNGIPINLLMFEEGGEYVGRRVVGRINPQTGELAESAFVGSPGPGRPGARMAAEKTRYFKDMNEAIAEGYRYLPPDEALFLNLKGTYNRIADKEISEWVLDRVAWRTTGAPDKLVEAALNARTKLWRSRQLEGALNRAVRGERIPGSTIDSIAETYPEQAKKLKNLIPDLQVGKPTADRVQSLTSEAKALTRQDEIAYHRAVNARARARESAMSPHLGEVTVQAPAFAGKIFTGLEARETARVLNKAFTTQYGDLDSIIGAVNKVNAVGRYFVLAADASPLLIQLIAFPIRFPKIYGRAAVNFARALFSEKSQAAYLAKNNDIIQKSRNLILTKGGQTEYTEAFRFGGIMQSKLAKYPAKAMQPFQRGFEAALDTAGIELRKAFNHIATTPERAAEIEQFINEIRGVTSSARIGVSPAIRSAETVVTLAPRYNRAIAALLSDVVRGGIRGDQARKALAALIAGGVAISTAIGLARGEGWEGVIRHLDIRDAQNFLTWEVAGQRIGPGSKLRTLTVLLGKIIKDPENTVGHVSNFLKGNFAPVLGTSYDIITGRDYSWSPTRPGKPLGIGGKSIGLAEGMLGLTRRVIAENLMPVWVQSTILEGGDIAGRGVRAVAEFAGGRAYPVEIYSNPQWAKDFKEYESIPSTKRGKYQKDNPDIDAKLFITKGQAIQTYAAYDEVLKLIKENKIDPMTIKAVRNFDLAENKKKLEEGEEDAKTDELIKELLKKK